MPTTAEAPSTKLPAAPPGILNDAASATDRSFKKSYAIITILAYTLIAFMSSRITINFQLAMGIFLTYNYWNLFWLKVLFLSPNMYNVKVPTGMIEDWIQLSIPYGAIQLKKDRIVTSISQLSGIRGTHMMVALRVMSAVINALFLVAIHVDLHYRNAEMCLFTCQTNADYVPLFMYIFCIGEFLTGHFELNLKDSFHTTMHYFGVLGIFTGSLMIGFVSNWSYFSIGMIASEYASCWYWFHICGKVSHKSKDLAEVTKNSKKCVGSELLVFFLTNTITVFTVNGIGPNEGNIWASPFSK